MKKKIIIGVIGVIGVIGGIYKIGMIGGGRVWGQEAGAEANNGLESCFSYYDYGKVEVNLATASPNYRSGETAKARGTLVNNNTFPLVGVSLYAHVRRVNTNNESFINNGHYLIDRLTLVENLSFLPGETKWVEAEFPILAAYPNGEYQLSYFVFSKEGFHYAGRPFLEEDTAGYSSFKIEGGKEAEIYFDIESLRAAGGPHNVREQIVEFRQGPIPITVNLLDKRKAKTNLQARVKYYKFEDTFEEDIAQDKVFNAGTGAEVDGYALESVFLPPGPGAYVFLAQINEPIQTMFKYRFAIKGEQAQELRMNDLGVTDFPAGKDSRAWICFHSPTNKNAPKTKVGLSVLDAQKNVVAEKVIEGEFGSEVMAISVPLEDLGTARDFWVKGEIGEKVVEKHYNCEIFGESAADFKAVYSEGDLKISGVGRCGEELEKGGYIKSVRVKDEKGDIVKEGYNLSFGSGFNLAGLPVGNYTAEVKSGDNIKKIEVKVKSSKKIGILGILGTLTILGILGGFYYFRKRGIGNA